MMTEGGGGGPSRITEGALRKFAFKSKKKKKKENEKSKGWRDKIEFNSNPTQRKISQCKKMNTLIKDLICSLFFTKHPRVLRENRTFRIIIGKMAVKTYPNFLSNFLGMTSLA
jgi:hypothetical protein